MQRFPGMQMNEIFENKKKKQKQQSDKSFVLDSNYDGFLLQTHSQNHIHIRKSIVSLKIFCI